MSLYVSYTFRKSAFTHPQHWVLAEHALWSKDQKTNEQTAIPYHSIQSIRIQFQPYRDFRHNNYRCGITLTNGRVIDILSTSYVGFAEFEDHADTYTPFVRALVQKTKSENPHCTIYTGQTPSAFSGNTVLILAAMLLAFFVIFAIPMGEGRLLSMALIIIGAWYYLRMSVKVNRPQEVDADEIPNYVLPQKKEEDTESQTP